MAKQYVFFRIPTTGKPYRGDDGKHAPRSLLSVIGRSSVQSDGHIGWSNFIFPKMEPAIRASIIVLDPDERELNEADSWGIVSRGLIETLKKAPSQPIQPKELLTEANQQAAAYFRQPESPYILVSSLSIDSMPRKTIRIKGCVVSSLAKRGSRFPLPDVHALRVPGSIFSEHLTSSRYRFVKVATKGRSIHEGTENALNALNVLRALWSFFATYGSWSMSLGGARREPLGVIHIGPIHTLHTPDGRLVENMFWYDPDFTQERPLFNGMRDRQWTEIEKARRSATKRIAAHQYRQELESILIRYVAALDQPNPDVAFLQMWSILEKITDTVGSKYDETIQRTVWHYSKDDRPIMRDVLESLRYRRNLYVHSGAAGNDGDRVGYLIKELVDPHLRRLLFNPFKVRSLEEYGELLATPTDLATLEKRRRQLTKALRMAREAPNAEVAEED